MKEMAKMQTNKTRAGKIICNLQKKVTYHPIKYVFRFTFSNYLSKIFFFIGSGRVLHSCVGFRLTTYARGIHSMYCVHVIQRDCILLITAS